jgi:CRISPR-associated endonuclease/helicase Cas3
VKSVVVLDEAQLLPPEFLDPIRHAMRGLVAHYGVTFVLSTATQPALGLEGARELAPDPADLDRRLRRVRFEWPAQDVRVDWGSLAADLRGHAQVLCVVNRRADAREVFERLRATEGALHLSALMCGAHRSARIADVRERLQEGLPVRLVSTQLIEAGVDLDFPVVYRAFAGLDSLAQAAGRCNREGKLPDPGRVVVFHAPERPPRGLLRKAEDKAREILAGWQVDHLPPELFTTYFDLLYRQGVNSLDAQGILSLHGRDSANFDIQFRTAAERFRLVDDSGYWPILVDWGDGADLIEEIRRLGPERLRMRRIQRYLVSIPAGQLQALRAKGDVEELLPGLFGVRAPRLYAEAIGLRVEGHEYDAATLVC